MNNGTRFMFPSTVTVTVRCPPTNCLCDKARETGWTGRQEEPVLDLRLLSLTVSMQIGGQ